MSSSTSLEACLLSDPVPQAGEASVDSRLVPLCAAIAPAHHPGQEHPAAGLHAHQGPPGVSLCRNRQNCEYQAQEVINSNQDLRFILIKTLQMPVTVIQAAVTLLPVIT